MGHYSLSVVQLCPDQFRDAANSIAEASGYGPGNLSVELRHADGSVWWGCHAWWIPAVFSAQTQLPEEAPQEWHDALAEVVSSVRDGGDPLLHWHEALTGNGLSVYAPEDDA